MGRQFILHNTMNETTQVDANAESPTFGSEPPDAQVVNDDWLLSNATQHANEDTRHANDDTRHANEDTQPQTLTTREKRKLDTDTNTGAAALSTNGHAQLHAKIKVRTKESNDYAEQSGIINGTVFVGRSPPIINFHSLTVKSDCQSLSKTAATIKNGILEFNNAEGGFMVIQLKKGNKYPLHDSSTVLFGNDMGK